MYSFNTQQQIISLKKQGMKSRAIATYLGIGKSGVNYFWQRYKETINAKSKSGPKIVFIDLETSASLAYCFGRHKQFINQDAIKVEGGKLLCSGYRWMHETKSTVLYNKEEVRNSEDYTVCKQMWDLFHDADIVVAHNAYGFDVRMLSARCLANGLPPLPKVKVLDTLQMARKGFRFPSNKLDSLGAYLGLGRKVQHSGIKLWVDVQEGSEEALEKMVEYCEQDVDLLVEIFGILRSRGLASSVNFALYYDDEVTRCKSCGSDQLEFTGRVVTTEAGIFDEVKCLHCESLHRSKVNKLSTTKRKSLLV